MVLSFFSAAEAMMFSVGVAGSGDHHICTHQGKKRSKCQPENLTRK
uniref:Uncharacterized protein n=1 Tax=Anguilla anguilla TaxID=7936 RepID=A0A0E9U8J4_ANGAN